MLIKQYLIKFTSGHEVLIDSDGYLDALAQAAALRARYGPVSSVDEQK